MIFALLREVIAFNMLIAIIKIGVFWAQKIYYYYFLQVFELLAKRNFKNPL